MCQPNKWIWGLLPLIPLWLFANSYKTSEVEADLGARSTAQVSKLLDKAAVSVHGRDVFLNGAAFTAEGQKSAIGSILAQNGVRLVNDSSTLIPEAKPYAWGAARDGEKVTLTGSVPDPDTRLNILKAAAAALPGTTITDAMSYGRGAGAAALAAGTGFGLKELGLLSRGEVGVADGTFSVKGEASDAASFKAATKAAAELPVGLKLGSADILPPIVKSYVLDAVKSADGIKLSGFVPSTEAESKLITAAKAVAPGGKVDDQLQIARGLPAGLDFGAISNFMMTELGNLKTGEAKFMDGVLSLKGDAPSPEALKAATAALASGLPAGLKLATPEIVGPPEPVKAPEPPKPAPAPEAAKAPEAAPAGDYNFDAVKSAKTITLTGSYPDEDTHQKILAVTKAKFFGVDVVDQTKQADGAPKNFGEAAISALSQLGRLDNGAASISNSHIMLKGEALYDNAAKQINSTIVTALPSGFVGESSVVAKAAAPVVEDAAKCQVMMSDLLSKGKIRFETGKASIHPDSFGFLDAVVAEVGRCPTTHFEVAGHTDNVGNPAANLELSRLRAQTTMEYLEKAGIPADRLSAVGYGETKPIASNDTDEGKAQNRRIEFLVK